MRPIDDYTQPLFTYTLRTSSDSSPSPERVEANVYLVNAEGDVLVAMEGVEVQRLGRSGGMRCSDRHEPLALPRHLAARRGRFGERATPPLQPPRTGAWLILSDTRGVGAALADQLAERGQASILVEHGTRLPIPRRRLRRTASRPAIPRRRSIRSIRSIIKRLFQEAFADKGRHCLGVVHLVVARHSDSTILTPRGSLAPASALQLARTLARSPLPTSPPLWLVTSGAQAVDGARRSPIARRAVAALGPGSRRARWNCPT